MRMQIFYIFVYLQMISTIKFFKFHQQVYLQQHDKNMMFENILMISKIYYIYHHYQHHRYAIQFESYTYLYMY